MGISNTYEAFCFDEACLHIQNALIDEREGKRVKVIFTEDKVTKTGERKTFQNVALKEI